MICMTRIRTLLSVRLEPSLAEALDEYCRDTGATRSYVVQEGVTQYLASRAGPTLSTLAEAVLPPMEKVESARTTRTPRQERYRRYVREKRRR